VYTDGVTLMLTSEFVTVKLEEDTPVFMPFAEATK
jgi:hypothetical protein